MLQLQGHGGAQGRMQPHDMVSAPRISMKFNVLMTVVADAVHNFA
jgi:hypothetical protein